MEEETKINVMLIILVVTMFTFAVSLPTYYHYLGIVGLIINGIMFWTLFILFIKTINKSSFYKG